MLIDTLLVAAGLVLLVIGGDVLVRGASLIARRYGVSPLVIGLVLVGFGTSTPELITSLIAAFENAPGIAVGNVVGSNTANILLILGMAAVIYPMAAGKRAFKRDGAALVLSALLCLAAVYYGHLGRVVGVFFLIGLAAYVWIAFKSESGHDHGEQETIDFISRLPFAGHVGAFIAGLVLTIIGAKMLVYGAIDIARVMGISDTIIGLTIVAVGTSLPELIASVMAALRKHTDIALGNILGSNIYNILGILGVTALVHPIDIPEQIKVLDIWVMLGATGALVACIVTSWKVTRLQGGLMMLAYAGYCGVLAYIA